MAVFTLDGIDESFFESEAFTRDRSRIEIAHYATRRSSRLARTVHIGDLLSLYIPEPFFVSAGPTYIEVPCDGDLNAETLRRVMDTEFTFRGSTYRFSGMEAITEQVGDDHVRGVQFCWTVVR